MSSPRRRKTTSLRNMPSRKPEAAAGVIFVVGARYFAAVFTIAVAMGIARTLWVAPRLGPMVAVLLEVPILVGISWRIARRVLLDEHLGLAQRAAVGAIALAMTLASEAVFASLIRGQSLGMWAATLSTPLGFVGLAGQGVFGAMPMIVFRDRIVLPSAPR